MKKILIIIVLLFCSVLLTGCPPEEHKFYKQFDIYYMNGNIYTDVFRIYQNDNDVIVLRIVDRNDVLDDFYIKAKSLDLTSVKVWGVEMPEVSVDGEMYYWVDAKNLKVEKEFYLELISNKNEVFSNPYYEEILKGDAIIHTFDCYFNDQKEEYRFGRECYDNEENYQEAVQFLNGIEDVFSKTVFSSLHLPIDYQLSKRMMYFPEDESLTLSDENQEYSIRVKLEPNAKIELGSLLNNDENWIDYTFNDINFKLLKRDVDGNEYFEVRFTVLIDDETLNSYYYHINETNLDSVKALLRTIAEVRIDNLN